MYRLPAILSYTVALLLLIGCKGDPPQPAPAQGSDLVQQLTQQINADQADADLYYQRSRAYYDNQQYAAAVSDAEQAIALDSLQPRYYHLLSDARLDNLDSRGALRVMDDASRLFSDRLPTLLKLAELQFILRQYEAALGTINHIFYLEKADPETFYMLGLILHETGEKERALNVLKEAVDRDPDLVDAWLLLGSIAEEVEDPLAKTYYENAVRLSPSNSAAKHTLAYYVQNNGDMPGAIDLYKQIIVADPQYGPAFLNMGVLYTSLDSLTLALEQFDILNKIQPQDPVPYYYKGIVYEEMGNIEGAREQYTIALRLNAGYEQARAALEAIAAN